MSKGGLIVTKPYLDVAYNIMVTLAQPAQGGVVGGDPPSPRWWKTSPR